MPRPRKSLVIELTPHRDSVKLFEIEYMPFYITNG